MMVKWLGAILIVAGCGGCGFSMAAAYRREERTLDVLSGCLNWMKCELQYRVTPLPQLFTAVAQRCDGNLKRVFAAMAEELENQISPDAASCMDAALGRTAKLPACAADILRRLGRSLGILIFRGSWNRWRAWKPTAPQPWNGTDWDGITASAVIRRWAFVPARLWRSCFCDYGN